MTFKVGYILWLFERSCILIDIMYSRADIAELMNWPDWTCLEVMESVQHSVQYLISQRTRKPYEVVPVLYFCRESDIISDQHGGLVKGGNWHGLPLTIHGSEDSDLLYCHDDDDSSIYVLHSNGCPSHALSMTGIPIKYYTKGERREEYICDNNCQKKLSRTEVINVFGQQTWEDVDSWYSCVELVFKANETWPIHSRICSAARKGGTGTYVCMHGSELSWEADLRNLVISPSPLPGWNLCVPVAWSGLYHSYGQDHLFWRLKESQRLRTFQQRCGWRKV
jgi:hypothetical protein